jgi:hypothetical protein
VEGVTAFTYGYYRGHGTAVRCDKDFVHGKGGAINFSNRGSKIEEEGLCSPFSSSEVRIIGV